MKPPADAAIVVRCHRAGCQAVAGWVRIVNGTREFTPLRAARGKGEKPVPDRPVRLQADEHPDHESIVHCSNHHTGMVTAAQLLQKPPVAGPRVVPTMPIPPPENGLRLGGHRWST